MTGKNTAIPMYLVPGKVTPEAEHRAANVVFDMYGREILWPVFHAYMTAIASPVQPCADVETVGYVHGDYLKQGHRAVMCPASMRDPISGRIAHFDTALVRRTDMEAQVAKIAAEMDAEIARLKENALPDQMTPDIEAALGIICFQAAPYAHAFRAVGADIPRKAEAEQAYVIFRLLKDVLRLGDFKKAFEALLEEARAAQKAGGAA